MSSVPIESNFPWFSLYYLGRNEGYNISLKRNSHSYLVNEALKEREGLEKTEKEMTRGKRRGKQKEECVHGDSSVTKAPREPDTHGGKEGGGREPEGEYRRQLDSEMIEASLPDIYLLAFVVL